jgi:hypothetical protein
MPQAPDPRAPRPRSALPETRRRVPQARKAPVPPRRQARDEEEEKRGGLPLSVIGWGLAGVVLAIYFLWFCIQMAGHAVTGGATLIATFGAVAVGLVAGGLAFVVGKRLK